MQLTRRRARVLRRFLAAIRQQGKGGETQWTSVRRLLLFLRWLVPVLIFLASALHEMALAWLLPRTSERFHSLLPVLVYGVTGSVAVWFGLGALLRIMGEREAAVRELQAAYEHLSRTHRRLLAMYDIGREIASAADMQRVLEIAARAPVSLLNARGASIFTFDEDNDRLHLDVALGLSDEYVRRLRAQVEAGIPADRCRSCEILRANVSGDCPLFQDMRDVAAREGIRSLACLPFGSGGKRDGILTAFFATPQAPPEHEMYTLSLVAAEIAGVLDSLRLRDRQMASMYALEHLGEAEENEEVLWQEVLRVTLSGWEVQRGVILIPTEQPSTYRWLAAGFDVEESPQLREAIVRVAESVMASHAPYVVPDVRAAAEFKALHGVGGLAAVPLLTGTDLLAVMVLLADQPGHFRAHHAPILLSIGYHAGLAVNNARLRARVEHLAVLEERYRISREIHDGLAQSLSLVGWRLDRARNLLERGEWDKLGKELVDIRAALRDAYQDVREAIDGLRLRIDHPEGLGGTLAEYAREFEARTGIHVRLNSNVPAGSIPQDVAMHLVRVVQEGLTNVRKHAAASQVEIHLTRLPGRVELEIVDDGQGFDPSVPRGRGHVGLSSMRERVRKLGGTFTLVSRPGAGTRISVVIPLPEAERVRLRRVANGT